MFVIADLDDVAWKRRTEQPSATCMSGDVSKSRPYFTANCVGASSRTEKGRYTNPGKRLRSTSTIDGSRSRMLAARL